MSYVEKNESATCVEMPEDEIVVNIFIEPIKANVTDLEEQPFRGSCIDTGAERSVVGKAQAEAYHRFMVIPLGIIPAIPRLYKFGTQRKARILKANFRIPYSSDRHKNSELDAVDINIPLLLGLDFVNLYKLTMGIFESIIV